MGESGGHRYRPLTLSWPILVPSLKWGFPAPSNFNLKPKLDSIGKPATLRRLPTRLTALNHEAVKCYRNVSTGNIQIKGQLERGGRPSQLQMTIITAEIQENQPCLLRRPIAQVSLFLAVQ